MGRTLSAAAQTEITKPDNSLGYLIEIGFQSFTGRYCTFANQTWKGLTFNLVPVKVTALASDGGSVTLTFFDEDASARTLCLTKPGIRNRSLKVWKFYTNALGTLDPIAVFIGVGDTFQWSKGQSIITGARAAASFLRAPRRRLGPATGCNFLAAPGTVIPWGDAGMILEPSDRG